MRMPPWSYSSLGAYTTCPKQYHETRVLKRYVQQESEQIKWGNEVHKAIEERGKNGTPLPERVRKVAAIAEKIQDQLPGFHHHERKFAVTVDLKATDFYAADAWSRSVVDFLAIKGSTAVSLDWKTGKRKEGSTQLVLSSAHIFANMPEVDKISTGFVWLAEGGKITGKQTLYRSEYDNLYKSFIPDLVNMQWSYDNDAWPPRPSGLCKRWCPVIDCEFNGLNPKCRR